MKKRTLRLNSLISRVWNDLDGNDRLHVILNMPTAMKNTDISNIRIRGDTHFLDLILPTDFYSAERILSHPRFGKHYSSNHPKWIALQCVADKKIGTAPHYQAKIAVKLPSSGFDLTGKDISGHELYAIYHHKAFDEEGNVIQAKTSIFCIFDLVRENANRSQMFSKRPTLEDDFEMD